MTSQRTSFSNRKPAASHSTLLEKSVVTTPSYLNYKQQFQPVYGLLSSSHASSVSKSGKKPSSDIRPYSAKKSSTKKSEVRSAKKSAIIQSEFETFKPLQQDQSKPTSGGTHSKVLSSSVHTV